jgi:hypothetical protein
MTQEQQHPITPPNELVQQWMEEAHDQPPGPGVRVIATRAAQWGADQELEALLVWLRVKGFNNLASDLLSARRPKPPSLKEQALEQLDEISTCFRVTHMGDIVCDKIRRALEALND